MGEHFCGSGKKKDENITMPKLSIILTKNCEAGLK
jgi:hypothetical protein